MKKLLVLLIAALLVFSFIACEEDETNASGLSFSYFRDYERFSNSDWYNAMYSKSSYYGLDKQQSITKENGEKSSRNTSEFDSNGVEVSYLYEYWGDVDNTWIKAYGISATVDGKTVTRTFSDYDDGEVTNTSTSIQTYNNDWLIISSESDYYKYEYEYSGRMLTKKIYTEFLETGEVEYTETTTYSYENATTPKELKIVNSSGSELYKEEYTISNGKVTDKIVYNTVYDDNGTGTYGKSAHYKYTYSGDTIIEKIWVDVDDETIEYYKEEYTWKSGLISAINSYEKSNNEWVKESASTYEFDSKKRTESYTYEPVTATDDNPKSETTYTYQ